MDVNKKADTEEPTNQPWSTLVFLGGQYKKHNTFLIIYRNEQGMMHEDRK